MADIRFACPHCRQSLIVEEEGVGLEVPCPHCGESLIIPPAEEADPPEEAAEDADPRQEIIGDSAQRQALPTPAPADPDAPDEEHHALPQPNPTLAPPDPSGGGSKLTASLATSLHKHQAESSERHGQDVNMDQPHFKKKDQWFSENHKKYHFCYYDPHSPEMKTACGGAPMPVAADVAPTPISSLKKGAFCKQCLDALGITAEDVQQ